MRVVLGRGRDAEATGSLRLGGSRIFPGARGGGRRFRPGKGGGCCVRNSAGSPRAGTGPPAGPAGRLEEKLRSLCLLGPAQPGVGPQG